MVLVWFIAFLSILLSFWVKYLNRTDKTVFNPWFWVKDNYPEMIVSFLSMIIILIIAGKIEFDQSKLLTEHLWITSLITNWDTQLEVLGWVVDTEASTVTLPPLKRGKLRTLLAAWRPSRFSASAK